jgi:hypothetical protein
VLARSYQQPEVQTEHGFRIRLSEVVVPEALAREAPLPTGLVEQAVVDTILFLVVVAQEQVVPLQMVRMAETP